MNPSADWNVKHMADEFFQIWRKTCGIHALENFLSQGKANRMLKPAAHIPPACSNNLFVSSKATEPNCISQDH